MNLSILLTALGVLSATSLVSAQAPFVTTWKTNNAGPSCNTCITIPTAGSGYNYEVDWDYNGTFSADDSNVTGDITHDYGAAGIYTVAIRGDFLAIYFNDGGDKNKIQTIEQWGGIQWATMENAFYGCTFLTYNAPDAPDLNNVTSLVRMFSETNFLNGNLGNWDVSDIENFGNMFDGALVFNGNINNWNVSSAIEMDSMFSAANAFNQDISGWNTGNVTDMEAMFRSADAFDQNIGGWDVSKVTNMKRMFNGADAFNQDIGNWNTGMVTDMERMFHSAVAFNQGLSGWDVSKVTTMFEMFRDAKAFNGDLSGWMPSSVTTMEKMFHSTETFNRDLTGWDVSSVTNMYEMFRDAEVFNGDLSGWNTGNVETMRKMFEGAKAFNQDISGWDVSKVINMESMFRDAEAFNQDIGGWDVSKVENMNSMLNSAKNFHHSLGDWDLSSITDMGYMLFKCGMKVSDYDNTLIGWAAQSPPAGLSLNATDLKYCNAETARTTLETSYNWNIAGDALDCLPLDYFITTWKTDPSIFVPCNTCITIPTFPGETYNYEVDWDYNGTFSADDTNVTGDIIHDYGTVGSYTVAIRGDFPRIYFNNAGNKVLKLLTIEQWGDNEWTSMEQAFHGCGNLTYNATDIPDLSGCTSLSWMFASTGPFNGDIGNWNTSTITDMSYMIGASPNFNQDIGGWNTENVTDMSGMFDGAASFNQNLNNWDVSEVTNMNSMFLEAIAFNGDISNWNTGKVEDMYNMFNSAPAFNQDISGWDVSSVNDMGQMFRSFLGMAFNQDLGDWDISSVTNMEHMLDNCSMDITNYDSTLIGWAAQTVQPNVNLGADGLAYSCGLAARGTLTNATNNWTITGDADNSTSLWTGNGNGTDWTDPANWDTGHLPSPCTHVTIPSGVEVTVPAASEALGRTLDVGVGGVLKAEPQAVMNIGN